MQPFARCPSSPQSNTFQTLLVQHRKLYALDHKEQVLMSSFPKALDNFSGGDVTGKIHESNGAPRHRLRESFGTGELKAWPGYPPSESFGTRKESFSAGEPKAWPGHRDTGSFRMEPKAARLQTGSFSTEGLKPKEPNWVNQDAHLELNLSENIRLLGVFDGHGPLGAQVSNRVKSVFAEMGPAIASASDIQAAFQQAFARARNQIYSDGIGNQAGTTATVALVDSVAQRVCIAHVGDSTAIVIDPRGNIVFRSQDHKPDAQGEAQRLLSYGTQVRDGRVPLNGRPGCSLAMSRAIGDFAYTQQGVTAEPDIVSTRFEPGSSLLLASDGVWDMLPKDQVVRMVMQSTPQESAQRIVSAAHANWASELHIQCSHIDDITAVLVKSVGGPIDDVAACRIM
jgi:serine/threonine protein phosphatase PrpC